jgi:hypothetical protein
MAKTWVLDTDTKGTGANVVPLEKVQERNAPAPDGAPRRETTRRQDHPNAARPRRARRPAAERQTTATPLPPGHVRKRATGEIGKVRSVDAQAGTATVHWLKRGAASTVPLSAISRR